MSQTKTLLYAVLKPWVSLGARLFFRRIEIDNIKNLPTDRPVILVSNHQNAMLDPVIACVYSRKQLHWLTRADVFRKPQMNALLRMLNMLPVFRERDRVADLAERNQETFDECFRRLEKHAVICIFPEGTHRGKKQLVSLKKGASRLVTGAIDAGVKGVCIVPVGLDYENYFHYRRNLLLRFGKPIELDESQILSGVDRAKVQTQITEKIRESLSDVMIDIRNDNIYHELIFLRPFTDKLSKGSLGHQFDTFKRISSKLDTSENVDHEIHDVRLLMKQYHQLKLQEDLFEENFSALKQLFIMIGAPILASPALLFYPIYALTENFVARVVKDPLFKNSIRLVFWTFITPFWILILYLLLRIFSLSPLYSLITTSAIILSSVLSLYWWHGWKKWMHHLHCNRLKKENSEAWNACMQKRTHVINWLKGLL